MKYGLVYRNATIYNMLLWFLYKGNPKERFKYVANLIPNNTSVLDLCAATDMLFRELKERGIDYIAVDINPKLIKSLEKRGIKALCADIKKDPFPESDIVVMNSSLYHFGPYVKDLVKKMIENARQKVIILEPVKNVADSKFSLLARCARWTSSVNGMIQTFHFTPETFENAMKDFPQLSTLKFLSNKRDMIAIFDK